MKNTGKDFQKSKNFSLDYSSTSQIPKDKLLNYNNLIKFNPEAIVTIINNYYTEEEKITLLRDNTFVELIPSYTLEMIINSMFFNSVFNMLQNKTIYNKIKTIDVNISHKDYYLIPGYLDTTNLVNKSSHLMLFNLLSVLDSSANKKYLSYDYIINKLTNHELITLASTNNIDILNLLISRKVNDYELENYINKMWSKKLDYSLLKSNYVKEHILKLSKYQIAKIDFNDVIYLFDFLNTHSVISIQETPHTIESFKSILSCYYVLGMKNTLSFIEEGNKKTSLNEIINLGNEIINNELYKYKINNANTFDNITGKVINELNNITKYNSLNDLINDSPYLRTIISLSNIYSYGDAVSFFNDYLKYEQTYEDKAKIKLYKFLNGLINNICLNQKEHMQNNFNNEIFKHYNLKSGVLYNKKKNYCKSYFTDLKVKVLLTTLTSQRQETYKNFYKEKYNSNNITELYKKGIDKYKINSLDTINDILKPLCNNTFSYEQIFKKLNIKMPDQISLIIEENNEQKLIFKINKELKKLTKDLSPNEKDEILNYLCFKGQLKNNKNKTTWKSIRDKIQYLNGNIFKDENYTLGYQSNILLENIDNYQKAKDIILNINNITKYTNSFASKTIDTDEIIKYFKNDINHYLSHKTFTFNINSHNYETSKNVFCLANIENIFSGFKMPANETIDDNFKETFINNNYLKYAAMGYFKNYYPNFGQLLSDYFKLNKETKKNTNYFEICNTIDNQKAKSHPLYKTFNDNTKQNLALNINESSKLYEQCYQKNYSTIPQIKGYINNTTYETCDFHNENLLTTYYPEIKDNYALHKYLCTNKNGCYINLLDTITNKSIGNISLIRNGNIVYLNKLNILEKNINIDELLNKISNELINQTKGQKESIDFVILNTYDDYYLTNCIKVNDQIIDNLINPIIDNTNPELFNDATSLLIASNKELSRASIHKYNPNTKYYRHRNNYKIISNLAPANEIDEINKLLYLKTVDKSLFIPIDIKKYKEIIYGDDWIIGKLNDNTLETINLDADNRAQNEINYFLPTSQKKTKSIRKIA